ncbi:MAG: hypothetical protein QW688_01835 [Thermoprotei archaeon]
MASTIFAHRRDVDGLMSAAIFLRVEPSSRVFFIDYGEENMEEFLRKFSEASRNSERLVIADFGLDDFYLERVEKVLAEVLSLGVQVYWLDHHNWSETALKEIGSMGVHLVKVGDREACGAELVWRVFNASDSYSKLLSESAHRTDYHLELNCVDRILVDAVDYYNTLSPKDCDAKMSLLARRVSSGVLVDAEIYGDYLKYSELESAAVRSLLENIHVFEVNGLKVAVGFTRDPLSATKSCDIIREKTHSDVQVSVKNRKVSFRRSNPSVDCSSLARLFKGGGHDYAASGELEFEVVDNRTMVEALNLIKARLKLGLATKN